MEGHKLIDKFSMLARFPQLADLHVTCYGPSDEWWQTELDDFVQLPCCERASLTSATLCLNGSCDFASLSNTCIRSLQRPALRLAVTDDTLTVVSRSAVNVTVS